MELLTCKRRGGRFGICTVETLSESFCPSTISNATALETWGCVLSLGFSSSERNNSRLLTLYEISLFFFFVLSQAWEKEKKNFEPHEESNLNFFSLSHARDETKNIFQYFFTELKTYHLSYSIYHHVFPSSSFRIAHLF